MKSAKYLSSILFVLFAIFAVTSSSAATFVGSDTYVVTNAATAVILVTNAPTSGDAAIAWRPAGILASFRDSPTGAVLIVEHIRSGIINRLVNSTNTISVTNTLYTSGTGAVSAIIWDPPGSYTVNPPSDVLRITTLSTNAIIILNKEVQR